ncbi:MAG: M23 family metallopeptidase [Thermoanaerobaculia bacterium]|nr:M23 family metallopeptidase [Thermoanaerobaculia bacterium]
MELLDDRRRPRRGRRLLFLVVAGALAWGALATFRTGPPPAVTIEPGLPGIGRATPVEVTFEEPVRGLAGVRVELIQGERIVGLAEREHRPRRPWQFWGPRTPAERIELVVGSETVDGLRQGEAVLRATAERPGTWIRHPDPVVAEATLPVRLTPPSISVLSTRHYPAQGGSGVVVYRVGEGAIADGVVAGGRFFRGWPLPGGGERDRFCLYGVPFDLTDGSQIRLTATDEVENRASVAFVDRFLPHDFERDDIVISTGFMEQVVPEILANTPELQAEDDLLATYLRINGELRRANAETIAALTEGSRPAFLWNRPFLPMPNAQVMSAFADRRTYLLEGRTVDRQDHLGIDLASVRRAPVPAANDGVVALARYLGIYGNAVVVDHGFGLMSLYGHLSSIAVEEGQPVRRGQEVGRTGETGLAAGDHLHFTMLIQGMPVSPIEWWDPRWIRDRVAGKLGEALDYSM